MQTDGLTTVEVTKVAWARSDGNPWWPVYVCDPSNLRSELHLLGSGHRRMLRKAKAEPDEYFLAFYFGSHHFRLHSRNDGSLKPWMCPSYYELLHGHSHFKRGPLKDAFREAIREVKEFLLVKEGSRVLPQMVPSDMDLSLDPPPPLPSQARVEVCSDAVVIDLDEEEGSPEQPLSSTATLLPENLPYNSLAWCYVLGKTWWPVYVCNPDIMLAHSKTVDKRARVGRLVTTYATEIRIAQTHKETQRLLYFFGTHAIRLHDTGAVVSNAGIKAWDCAEHDQFMADTVMLRKDEEFARAMKELKDYLSLDLNKSTPPYVTLKSPPSSAEPSQDPPSIDAPLPPSQSPTNAPSRSETATHGKRPAPWRSNEPPLRLPKEEHPSGPSSTQTIDTSSVSPPTQPSQRQQESCPSNMPAVIVVNVSDKPGGAAASGGCDETHRESNAPENVSRNTARQPQSAEAPMKTEAKHYDSSVPTPSMQDGVAWAFLNGQLWWPVRVFGQIAYEQVASAPDVSGAAATEQGAPVYYFGRKSFGTVEHQHLKPWNGPDHNSLIYEQAVLESKSRVFVSAFVDAVAEAGDFVAVFASLTERAADASSPERAVESSQTSLPEPSPAEDSSNLAEEPPQKKQMVEEPSPMEALASHHKSLTAEFVMLRNVVQAVVPAWKVAVATTTIENFAEFTKSLQIVMARLHTILRKIADNPVLISTPLVFVSSYHSVTMCLWTVVLSFGLRSSSPPATNDVRLMQKCLQCFLESMNGVFKPLQYSRALQHCLHFANEVHLFARVLLAPEVEKVRSWMYHFFMMYLSLPLTSDQCRRVVPDVKNPGLRNLPSAIQREFAKIDATRRDFETGIPPVDPVPAAAATPTDQGSQTILPDGSVATTVSFYGDSLGLHIGEVKGGLCVLGVVKSAPEQTQRIVQTGAVARGDFIIEVNFKSVAALGGFNGLCSIVASGARPIVITFRRAASRCGTAVAPDKAQSAQSATKSNTNVEARDAPKPHNSFLGARGVVDFPSVIQTLDDLNPTSNDFTTPPVIVTEISPVAAAGRRVSPMAAFDQEPRFVEYSDASRPPVQNELRYRQRHDPRLNRNAGRAHNNARAHQSSANVEHVLHSNAPQTSLNGHDANSGWANSVGYNPVLFPAAAPTHNVTVDQAPRDHAMQFYNPPSLQAVAAPGYLGPPNFMNYPPPPVVYLAVPSGHPWYNSVLQQSMAPSYPMQHSLLYQQHNSHNKNGFTP